MAITIKEVHVKTTVERNLNQIGIDETLVRKLTNQLYQKMKYEAQKDIRKKRER